jgi:hypothetical protein
MYRPAASQREMPMTFWDWLVTPAGVEATHAGILVLTAAAAVLGAAATRVAQGNKKLLNDHLEEHVRAAARDRPSP